jgi:hypothetical protein
MDVLNRYIKSFAPSMTQRDMRNEALLIDDNLSNFEFWNFSYDSEKEKFPLATSVRMVQIWMRHFPGLPRMFWVGMDPHGRPMYRWSAWGPRLWRGEKKPHAMELRISFKSVSFVRITIEGLLSCELSPQWDDSELLNGTHVLH